MPPTYIRTTPLTISIDGDGPYSSHEVYLNDVLIGVRPYDGSVPDEVIREVTGTLADMLRESLGYLRDSDIDPYEGPDDAQAIHP